MGVTKSKLHLWDCKCAYQLCYLCVLDKSANAGTTLFGGFDVDHSKTPHLNQGDHRDNFKLFMKARCLCLMKRIGLVATCVASNWQPLRSKTVWPMVTGCIQKIETILC